MKCGIRLLMAVFLLAATALPALYAGQEEDVEKLIEQGREAYMDGNYGKAADIFSRIAGIIQKKSAVSLKEFIPDPPSGWTGDEIDVQTGTMSSNDMSISTSSVSRDYTRESDGIRVRLMISNSPKIYNQYQLAVKSMKGNPMMKMAAKQQGAEMPAIEEKHGWDVLIGADKEDGEITAIHSGAVVNVSGGISDDSRMIFDLVDLKGLAKVIKEQNK